MAAVPTGCSRRTSARGWSGRGGPCCPCRRGSPSRPASRSDDVRTPGRSIPNRSTCLPAASARGDVGSTRSWVASSVGTPTAATTSPPAPRLDSLPTSGSGVSRPTRSRREPPSRPAGRLSSGSSHGGTSSSSCSITIRPSLGAICGHRSVSPSRPVPIDDAFEAWAHGRTGFPFVDAGMRQLRAEGWMHNRVRMVVASFLVKDLHLPWWRGEREFMRWLVDGDPASNAHGWQWVAGSGADPRRARTLNPIRQARRYDPHGAFVRRYVRRARGRRGPAGARPLEGPGAAAPHRLSGADRPDPARRRVPGGAAALGRERGLDAPRRPRSTSSPRYVPGTPRRADAAANASPA